MGATRSELAKLTPDFTEEEEEFFLTETELAELRPLEGVLRANGTHASEEARSTV
ncbi:MAG TPA: hypothetical protein VE220_04790 [Gaiellaceae bacterium]|jgi:hypothetical protein|nr:hypothetical protein [Gaiellaceae bacterium]